MKKTVLYLGVIAIASALLFTACEFGFDTRPDAAIAAFVQVEDITGVPADGQPNVSVPLAATVVPANATNKRIDWSIVDAGTTGAALDGSRLTAAAEGTVTVTATIAGGLEGNVDYTKNFDILISLTAIYAVRDIYGIPGALPIGDFSYTLNGKITPDNASYQNIVWSVIDDGGTGAAVTPEGFLSAQRKGTVGLLATIANGRLTSDYTQEFSILITRGVIAAGTYNINGADKACYWVNGEFNALDNAGAVGESRTVGIVSVNGKQYIAGDYVSGYEQRTICYWVNDEERTLQNSVGTNDVWTTHTRALSIAAGGAYVYILGTVDGALYYWKIDANNDSGAVLVELTVPGGINVNDISDDFGIVVKNNGNVVIASQYFSYYWESTGNDTTIAPVRITVFDGVSFSPMGTMGLVNNDVYLVGTKIGGDSEGLFYYILGNPSYYDFNIYFDRLMVVNLLPSVIVQNGVPVFYAQIANRHSNANMVICYWGIDGNLIDILLKTNADTSKIVFSDGDVYVPVKEKNTYGYVYTGYAVLGEPYPIRKVSAPAADYANSDHSISGIVVIGE